MLVYIYVAFSHVNWFQLSQQTTVTQAAQASRLEQKYFKLITRVQIPVLKHKRRIFRVSFGSIQHCLVSNMLLLRYFLILLIRFFSYSWHATTSHFHYAGVDVQIGCQTSNGYALSFLAWIEWVDQFKQDQVKRTCLPLYLVARQSSDYVYCIK